MRTEPEKKYCQRTGKRSGVPSNITLYIHIPFNLTPCLQYKLSELCKSGIIKNLPLLFLFSESVYVSGIRRVQSFTFNDI